MSLRRLAVFGLAAAAVLGLLAGTYVVLWSQGILPHPKVILWHLSSYDRTKNDVPPCARCGAYRGMETHFRCRKCDPPAIQDPEGPLRQTPATR